MSGDIEIELDTLDLPPSWVNRAGRVDRSACLEVRAAELRQFVDLTDVHHSARPAIHRRAARSSARPSAL